MRYYLIAGESSGDLHGSNLITSIKAIDKEAEFRIVGGDLMEKASNQSAFLHSSQMSFMGFVEVLMNIGSIWKNIRSVKNDIKCFGPDCIILIDFPGFNLRIAEFAKRNGIFVCYYISPKVWAWNEKRVDKVKRYVDRMICILPFEKEFYAERGIEVDYVGNPLLDAIHNFSPRMDFRRVYGLDVKPIVALLPGSRKMEIEKLLPQMISMKEFFPGFQFVIAGAPNFTVDYYRKVVKDFGEVPIVIDGTYDLLSHARAAIVTSGTATLEAALLMTPQVVVYRANGISVWLAKRLLKIKYISLVNLIMDLMVVRELIQEDFNERLLKQELDMLLNDQAYRENMLQNYEGLVKKLGSTGSSERVAKIIVASITSEKNSRRSS